MSSDQAWELEQLQDRLGLPDGDLMRLARAVAHQPIESLAELRRSDCGELIVEMEAMERAGA
jgi:hypothetical protein